MKVAKMLFLGPYKRVPQYEIARLLYICITMAKNGKTGDGHRNGAVDNRSQFQHPNGHWIKRDANTGRIMDVKHNEKPFKGVRKEN